MIGDVIRPEWVNPEEPWLVEVRPGQWVTATDEDLKASVLMAMEELPSPDRVLTAVALLLKQGKIRRNQRPLPPAEVRCIVDTLEMALEHMGEAGEMGEASRKIRSEELCGNG